MSEPDEESLWVYTLKVIGILVGLTGVGLLGFGLVSQFTDWGLQSASKQDQGSSYVIYYAFPCLIIAFFALRFAYNSKIEVFIKGPKPPVGRNPETGKRVMFCAECDCPNDVGTEVCERCGVELR